MTSFSSVDTTGLKAAAAYLYEQVQDASFAIVLLSGDLGAGKTTLTQEVAHLFGLEGISSPTYSVLKSYDLPDGREMHHLDLYRTVSREELEVAGIMELFWKERGIFFVEWPKFLEDVLPHVPKILHVTCTLHPDGRREVAIT